MTFIYFGTILREAGLQNNGMNELEKKVFLVNQYQIRQLWIQQFSENFQGYPLSAFLRSAGAAKETNTMWLSLGDVGKMKHFDRKSDSRMH